MNQTSREVSAVAIEDRSELEKLIAGVVEDAGYWCETVKVAGSHEGLILRVLVDATEGSEGVTLDEIGEISLKLSEVLDTYDDVPEIGTSAYNLEVSTPGTARPLTTPRHFQRNISRVVELTVTKGDEARTINARIYGADDDAVQLAEIKPGAKKGMPAKELPVEEFSYEILSEAVVQVELS